MTGDQNVRHHGHNNICVLNEKNVKVSLHTFVTYLIVLRRIRCKRGVNCIFFFLRFFRTPFQRTFTFIVLCRVELVCTRALQMKYLLKYIWISEVEGRGRRNIKMSIRV